jgi:hypothetical protein
MLEGLKHGFRGKFSMKKPEPKKSFEIVPVNVPDYDYARTHCLKALFPGKTL